MTWATPDPDAPPPAPTIRLDREYGCAEAADLCGVSASTIQAAVRDKRLPATERPFNDAQTMHVIRGIDLWIYFRNERRRVKKLEGMAPAERSNRRPAAEGGG